MSEQLLIEQRLRVRSLTASEAIHDQDGTVKGYTNEGEILVRFDTSPLAMLLAFRRIGNSTCYRVNLSHTGKCG